MSEGKVFAVSSGAYSDYYVDCLFERREDAEAYAQARNEVMQRRTHGYAQASNNERYAAQHQGRYEDCAACQRDGAGYRVEEFDFYPAGVVPVSERG